MGIEIRIVRQTTPGSATTQDYTDGDLTETVKALFQVYNKSVTDGTVPETFWGIGAGLATGAGIADGDQAAQGASVRPGIAIRGEHTCDAAVMAYTTTGVGADARNNFATLDSFITNGARLSFSISVNPITNAAVLFGGSDLSVYSGVTAGVVSAGQEVHDTGLDHIDVLFVIFGGRFVNGFSSTAGVCNVFDTSLVGTSIGFVAQKPDGTIEQACVKKSTNSACRIASGRCYESYSVVSPGAPTFAARVIDITGGRITFDDDGLDFDPRQFAFLALDFGGQAQATVQVISSDRTDSTISVPFDFRPIFAMLAGTHLQTADTTDTSTDASPFSIGMIDVDKQNVAALENIDGTVPGTPHTYTNTGELWVSIAEGALSYLQVAEGALTATGLDLDFTTHDTTADRLAIVLGIGMPGAIPVDEQVEVSDEVSLLRTDLEATTQETVEVSDSVELVLTDVELELEPNQKPKGTARAGPDASQAYGG